MPLQSLGPISVNDIQTEFGGSNPTSLSEYYRGGTYVADTPANSGIPTSGAISLTDFYGAAATATTFFKTLSSVNIDKGAKNYFDGTDLYSVGETKDAVGDQGALTVKYGIDSGSIIWQRVLGLAGSGSADGITADSSGNVYIAGTQFYNSPAGHYGMVTAKYNSSGVLQWQRVIKSTSSQTRGYGIVTDNTNVYVVGTTDGEGAGSNDALIVCYNASGVLQWRRVLGGTTADYSYDIAITGSVLYVTGDAYGTGTGFLAKYNTSGVLQWQRKLTSVYTTQFNGTHVDTSGNVYVTGTSDSTSNVNDRWLVMKFNLSGSLQWQRRLSSTAGAGGWGICTDGSNNVFVTGNIGTTGVVVRYNSSGVLQWQRDIGSSSPYSSVQLRDISTDGTSLFFDGYVYHTTNNYEVFVGKVPDDGTDTGTYGNFTYASSSATDAAGVVSVASGTLTDAASTTLTDAAGTLTDTAGTLTNV